ncbi:MAG: PTS glucose transporter subunit IIA [Clostridia bacterium]|nr:PTS glucose transporter subunit IIA [Clostridia bacterium]
MNAGRIILFAAVGVVLIGAAVWLLRLLLRQNTTAPKVQPKEETTGEILVAPLNGIAVPLEQVRDEVFSAGVLGSGMAIIPTNGELYAPADGVIANIPESRHAIAMTADSGIELLMHVGIDTVNLKGEPFTLHVKTGDRVRRGQPLMSFALDKIKEAGYDPVTPVILTESDGWTVTSVKGEIRAGDVLMSLEKKNEQK